MAVAERPVLLPGSNYPQLVADNEEEHFDIVDDDNRVIGREKRIIVHKTGLKHRAVYCFVFDKHGNLLVQQRSPRKKIGPLQWDLSVAEHLQPGESYAQAAARGLQEELGITADASLLEGPIVPVHLRQLDVPELGVRDHEFVTSFRLNNWEGKIKADPAEVHNWRFGRMSDIQGDMELHAQNYTPWFRAEVHAVADQALGHMTAGWTGNNGSFSAALQTPYVAK